MGRVLEIPFAEGEDTAKCMRKLHRVPWACGATAEVGGFRFGLRVADAALLVPLLDVFPPGARYVRADAPARTLYSVIREAAGTRLALYVGPRLLLRASAIDEVRAEIEAHLDTVLAVSTPDRVFVHAGVVALGGRALVLPGASRAGKSTLVRALVARGMTYYSDDAAVFDAQGRVHPYPRPIALRAGPAREGEPATRRVAAPRVGKKALPVAAIVFTQYLSESAFAPAAMAPARAALEMLGHALSARTNPTLALRVLGRITRRAPAYQGPRGEAAEAATALFTLLRREKGEA